MDLFNIKKRLKQKEERKAYEEKCAIYRKNEPDRRFKAYKYWTPELIEWISDINDAVKLAAASCLVNSHKWPEWLPSKPNNYDEKGNDVILHFVVDVHKVLKNKSEVLCPGLYQKIWMTKYYNKINYEKKKSNN